MMTLDKTIAEKTRTAESKGDFQ